MMKLHAIMLGLVTLAFACSVTGQSPAQAPDSNGALRAAERSPRVAVRRIGSTLLVNVDETAKALGWEAKVVAPGKLLTLCRGGENGICIPIRLDRVEFRPTSDGMYLEAATIERALQIEFKDGTSESASFETVVANANSDHAIPAYNADWGSGRGFRVGQTLPDIPLIDLDGREVRFSRFLGKRYIIYCWASW